ncbi:MAG: helix-turn-helix transcriptional regulator [Tannerellaceae bacterium]|nr:helix-turn-helix transcriptional regulator [Tannerellaceae bacterium]
MIESISEFYQRIDRKGPEDAKGKEFIDLQPSRCNVGKVSFSYRDFYKIALVTEKGKLYYADRWIMVDRPALLFSNPLVPYAWEALESGTVQGSYCIFNELFIKAGGTNSPLMDTPLFDISKERIYFLEESSMKNVQDIFSKIEETIASDYLQKNDMIRCYLHLLVHEAMKVQATSRYVPHKNAGQRIAELFLALLERQFPIGIPENILKLKTATDFAHRLSVHVNHLNRVVKAATGRTTSTLINNRITQEAVRLLQRSNYSISEIAFALGFEEPASFSNFIKKHTGASPSEHRLMQTA